MADSGGTRLCGARGCSESRAGLRLQKTGGAVKNDPGGRAKLEGKERLLCLDATSSEQLWQHEYDCPYSISYPSGPRCTPTVANNKIYLLGAEGRLTCLSLEGRLLWTGQDTERHSWWRYFLFSETGDLIVVNLTPEAYEEISRAHILEPTGESFGRKVVWSHPAFANKSCYARNDKEIVCVDLAK